MTVSATSDFELSVEDLLKTSLRVAGLLGAEDTANPAYLALGRVFLGMEMDALQAEGVVLRKTERTTLPLIAGTASYTLDADTIDIIRGPDSSAGTIVDSSSNESRVTSITQHEYQVNVTNKTSQSSRPTYVMVECQALVTLTFWPVPSTTYTFRYTKIRLPRDSEPGSATLDLARRWQKAMTYACAWQLAQALRQSDATVSRLQKVAEVEKAKAKTTEVGPTSYQLVPMGYR